jgi:predicted secreted Zn-dependent protease
MVRGKVALALDTLEYARRLREAGFSEQQAEGQARALAAAMTDSLATKQNLWELETRVDARFAQVDARFAQIDARFDALEKHFDLRLDELEKRFELRLGSHGAHLDARLVDLERRVTLRLGALMVASVGALSAIVKLL